jgi:hypothetical protein
MKHHLVILCSKTLNIPHIWWNQAIHVWVNEKITLAGNSIVDKWLKTNDVQYKLDLLDINIHYYDFWDFTSLANVFYAGGTLP